MASRPKITIDAVLYGVGLAASTTSSNQLYSTLFDVNPRLSTTSPYLGLPGRFISRICEEVVEFGPVNASIHKIDEHVEIASLDALKNVYRATLERLISR